MSQLTLTHPRLRRASLPARELALGPVTLATITIMLGLVIGLFYLSQSNRIATRGYEITKLQGQKAELQADQGELEIPAARLQSIQTIREGVKDSGMVPVTQTV